MRPGNEHDVVEPRVKRMGADVPALVALYVPVRNASRAILYGATLYGPSTPDHARRGVAARLLLVGRYGWSDDPALPMLYRLYAES